MSGLTKALGEVQFKLKAPKGQTNSFGHYRYRSCEDILEAVKPLLHEAGLTLTLSDEIVAIGTQPYTFEHSTVTGSRFYVKATATVTDGTDTISNTAFAREAESKKGMDDSQVTGTASSYARKYALNGLFCIDDTRDADTDEYHRRTQSQPIMCTHCGNPIKPLAKRDGGTMTPADVARWTQREANMTLCGDCLKAWRQAKANNTNNQPNNQ